MRCVRDLVRPHTQSPTCLENETVMMVKHVSNETVLKVKYVSNETVVMMKHVPNETVMKVSEHTASTSSHRVNATPELDDAPPAPMAATAAT